MGLRCVRTANPHAGECVGGLYIRASLLPQDMVAPKPLRLDPLSIIHGIDNAVSAAGPGREFYRV